MTEALDAGAGESAVGALHGVRVVELASEPIAWAGKLLTDIGSRCRRSFSARRVAMRRYSALVGMLRIRMPSRVSAQESIVGCHGPGWTVGVLS